MPQDHSIVFTKANFIEFLKTKGVEVGPNFTELNRLPKYATVGKFTTELTAGPPSGNPSGSAVSVANTAPSSTTSAAKDSGSEVLDASSQAFRPSRRVRQQVGGSSGQVRDLFASHEPETPRVSTRSEVSAPQQSILAEDTAATQPRSSDLPSSAHDEQEDQILSLKGPAATAHSVPSEQAEPQPHQSTFRPSRRVRVPGGTGGKSSIILG